MLELFASIPTVLMVLGAFLVLMLVAAVIVYNQLVALRNNREQAFSDIDVQLKLRYDLVPNLINTVKGYATHEKGLFEEVTKMRSLAMNAEGVDAKVEAENKFNATLKSLFAVAENYPELKANESFLQLQRSLSDVENKIAAARRFFNFATKEYNTVLMSFPANVYNMFYKFKPGNFFDLGSEAAVTRENVAVKFDK